MGKKLDVASFVNIDNILDEMENLDYVALAIGDKYHDDDEVVDDMPYFIRKESGGLTRDDSRGVQYYYVNAVISAPGNKGFNFTDVQLRSEELSVLEEMRADEVYSVTFDREKSELMVVNERKKNVKPYLSVALYVTSVQGVD